jgi:hypothetical protein
VGIKWKEGGQKGNNKESQKLQETGMTESERSGSGSEIMLTHSDGAFAPASPLFLWKKENYTSHSLFYSSAGK